MTTQHVIRLARFHVDANKANESSARFCLSHAVLLDGAGDLDAARAWAVKSLKHSLGILSPVYQRAISL